MTTEKMTPAKATELAERLLGNLVHYRKGGGHRTDDAQMIAQELRRVDDEARSVLPDALAFVSWFREQVIKGQITVTDIALTTKPGSDCELAQRLRTAAGDPGPHLIATTCVECGAKGEQPGSPNIVHKTILCDKCKPPACTDGGTA